MPTEWQLNKMQTKSIQRHYIRQLCFDLVQYIIHIVAR